MLKHDLTAFIDQSSVWTGFHAGIARGAAAIRARKGMLIVHDPAAVRYVVESQEKVNILIVDDDPAKLTAMEAVLAGLGHNLIKANSGAEALMQCLDHDFAVILLDLRMPGMDGFETASLIRQRQRSERTPIIFVTSYGHTEMDMMKGYATGVVDYMFTPVVPEILLGKVMAFADLFKKSEEVRRQKEQLERHMAEIDPSVYQKRDGDRFRDAKDYCNNFVMRTQHGRAKTP